MVTYVGELSRIPHTQLRDRHTRTPHTHTQQHTLTPVKDTTRLVFFLLLFHKRTPDSPQKFQTHKHTHRNLHSLTHTVTFTHAHTHSYIHNTHTHSRASCLVAAAAAAALLLLLPPS